MKRNIMLLLCRAALTASAQTDVTADYLTHYDFDSGFHHKAGATTEVKQEIKTITGWTAGFTVDYTITGAPRPSPRHLRRRRQESGKISCHV